MSEATPRIRYVGLDVHKETITVTDQAKPATRDQVKTGHLRGRSMLT